MKLPDLVIPCRFKLFHEEWAIVWGSEEMYHKDSEYGECDFEAQVITITKYLKDKPKTLMHTTLHEVFHAMLYMSGHAPMTFDESFVEAMSGMLCQVLCDHKPIYKEITKDDIRDYR